jgi:hypothetical protein
VDIEINNEEIDLKMKLGENGVALFVEKISENEESCSTNEPPRPVLNEEDTQEDDDEIEGIHLNAAAKTNNLQQPSTSSDLTDGALSDSEVDRQRNQPNMVWGIGGK